MLTATTRKPIAASLEGEDSSRVRAAAAVSIPTFNNLRFLSGAIESVLAQTRRTDEIIVVDDGSTDDLATLVTRFQRLMREDDRGSSATRNSGLRSSTNSHVSLFDTEDRLPRTAIETGPACVASLP